MQRRAALLAAVGLGAVLAAAGGRWFLLSGLPALRVNLAHPWIRQCMAQPEASGPSSFFLPPVHAHGGRFCLSAPSTDTSLRDAPEGGRAFAQVRDLTRIEVWDGAARRYWLLTGHTGRVRCYAVSGTALLTASDDRRDTPARLWSLETGTLVRAFDAGQPACWGGFGFMGFSEDGRMLLTATADRRVRLWDAATGAALAVIAPGEGVTRFALSPDGRTLALGGFSGDVQVWDLRAPRLLRSWHAHDRFGMAQPDTGGVESLAFSPDGARLASQGPVDGRYTLRQWDIATGMAAGQ